jgi:hypothetical protein
VTIFKRLTLFDILSDATENIILLLLLRRLLLGLRNQKAIGPKEIQWILDASIQGIHYQHIFGDQWFWH